ncbi:hypothetical protein J437_LFUL001288 [Ladona fulva]|uniref:Uncharacterized protein n=1 Tax=Ladona fulva TaxID=123851 RepID=A0A8K0JT47_LADFU|nr:hypothetical protein J437_LFUL001288 [Ladona fulva]
MPFLHSRSNHFSPASSPSDHGSPKTASNADIPTLQMSPLDMDLMGDLQDVIFRKCSILNDNESSPSPPVNRMEENKDLIHLNSTPSDDEFDPLRVKNSSYSTSQQQTAEGSVYDNGVPNTQTGSGVRASSQKVINNPLYPYFEPLSPKKEVIPQPSFLHSGTYSHEYDCRDSDLLREYGIDFNSMKVTNGFRSSQETAASCSNEAKASDPFEGLVSFGEKPTKKDPKKDWTKFE